MCRIWLVKVNIDRDGTHIVRHTKKDLKMMKLFHPSHIVSANACGLSRSHFFRFFFCFRISIVSQQRAACTLAGPLTYHVAPEK